MDERLFRLPTLVTDVDAFAPAPNSVYIGGQSQEERARRLPHGVTSALDVELWSLIETGDFFIEVQGSNLTGVLRLRSAVDLRKLVSSLRGRRVYLDITSLSHHVWAPVLKAFVLTSVSVDVLYVEPEDYRPNPHPLRGEIFALSEKIRGLSPLPGFASLGSDDNLEFCFVPLLGFEGARFAYLLEKVEPSGDNVIPVVGVPGFRLEYPFHTYQGNRQVLSESKSWRNVRYARANCPYSLFYLLEAIARDKGCRLKIAPIGTKPHALGAVLFSILHPELTELVYDHPIRKAERTVGREKLLCYPLANFVETRSHLHV